MERENELNQNQEVQNELEIEQEQNNFLQSTLGQVVNTALDTALRWILPDFVEGQVIEIKDSLITGGLKEGIDTAINNAINLGKSIVGVFTGNFENISQAQSAIQKGGIIDGLSDVIDNVLNKTQKSGLLNQTITNFIRQGKNIILDNVSKNISQEFTSQLNSLEKLGKYEKNWKTYYEAQDFNGMEREYGKIKEQLKNLMPMENTIKEARNIENIHLLIKNNGKDFNLSNEELELAQMLT